MQYAIANSPSAKRQQYSNDNYKQDYINAIANMLPSISGSVSAERVRCTKAGGEEQESFTFTKKGKSFSFPLR